MKVYSEFVDSLLRGGLLRGGCRGRLMSFFLEGEGGNFGTHFGWHFISCLDTMCINFTVTSDKVNLFGDKS